MDDALLYETEKFLKDNGWKIHTKERGRKFWENPRDGRLYTTSHAYLAQSVYEEQEREASKQAALEHRNDGLEDLDRFVNWEPGTLEEIVPPLEEKPAPKKKTNKKSKSTTIAELGF